MTDMEIISDITTIRVKMFTHNDLDGVSCALALKKLYDSKRVSFNYSFIGYDNYDQIKEFFNPDNPDGAKKYDYLFITDLNFTSEKFSRYLLMPYRNFITDINSPHKHRASIFKKIFLIDHHQDSELAIRPKANDYFNFLEYYNDLQYCGSYQLFDFLIHNKSREWTNATLGYYRDKIEDRKAWLKSYLTHVNDWDTFNWKNNGNRTAVNLNLIFKSMNRSKFFLMQEQKEGPAFAFNKTEMQSLQNCLDAIDREYDKALKSSVVLDHIDKYNEIHPDIQYIVIRSDDNISMVADRIREQIRNKEIYSRFNIKYIVNISFKNGALSFRRIFDDINLAEIANIYGGGGHEFAAGAPLNGNDSKQLERFIMPTLRKYGEPLNTTNIN